jgi:uncharacterized protein
VWPATLPGMSGEFEWDPHKDRVNRLKHGVGFDEACTVFDDPHALTIHDKEHSRNEDRYVIVGSSNAGRLLVVSHTDRGDRIRIISARRASPRERRRYEHER